MLRHDIPECDTRFRVRPMIDYGFPWLLLPMLNFAILLRSVFAWRFRILAAPFGPSITPSVRLKAAMMWLRSICSRLGKDASADDVRSSVIGRSGVRGSVGGEVRGRKAASSERTGPFESTTARSIIFCSSRTFPGHA